MKVEEKHFTFKIEWTNIKDQKESLEKLRKFLVGIGWLSSVDDRNYIDLFSYHTNNDLTAEITIDDCQRNPSPNIEWAEELFEALKKDNEVLEVSLLMNKASTEMVDENLLDYPFNTQKTDDYFVIYHKGIKRI